MSCPISYPWFSRRKTALFHSQWGEEKRVKIQDYLCLFQFTTTTTTVTINALFFPHKSCDSFFHTNQISFTTWVIWWSSSQNEGESGRSCQQTLRLGCYLDVLLGLRRDVLSRHLYFLRFALLHYLRPSLTPREWKSTTLIRSKPVHWERLGKIRPKCSSPQSHDISL